MHALFAKHRMDSDFTDRTLIVTGGASGIGRSVALTFAAHGARLVIADINDAGAAAGAAEIRAAGGKAASLFADLADPAAPGKIVGFAAETWGRVDVVIHNAAFSP